MRALDGRLPKIVDGGMISYADPIHILRDSDAIAVNRGLFDFDTVVLRSVPNNTIDLVSKVSGRGVRLDFPALTLWAFGLPNRMLRLLPLSPGRATPACRMRTMCWSIVTTSSFWLRAMWTSARSR